MTTLLVILLVAAMAATAYVLVRGVIAMASGKDLSGEAQQVTGLFGALTVAIERAIDDHRGQCARP